ncbi:acyl carrier protein [Thiomonas intermedia]|uniref:acyl carrier protein n=1 Tax=Thiomonas intermedia TaxID=926 RepID=UPI0009A483ED|nr:acyl carrier protein [Thiomonas intermedia]
MLEQLIKNYLVTHAKIDPVRFDHPDLTMADLGLDSLALVEMLFEIEDRFGFQIADPMQFQTLRFSEMVASIEAEVRAHHHGHLPQVDALDSSVSAS